jgi:hypothetical protein
LSVGSVQAHWFVGAQTASVPIAFFHLCHLNLLSPFPFIHSVLPEALPPHPGEWSANLT